MPRPTAPRASAAPGCRFARWLALASVVLALGQPALGTPADAGLLATNRLHRAYDEAVAKHRADTNEVQAAWNLGRATFNLAEVAPSGRRREELAQEGVAACRAALARDPRSAPAYYYLGMNLGQIARVRRFSALGLVHQMEEALLAALQLDPAFDHAGPDRILGLLYRQAPGWPVSLGSKTKARRHLQAAAKLAPEFPENRLNLAEALLEWKQPADALREVVALRKIIPKARTHHAGPDWEEAWRDWDARWVELQKAVAPLERPDAATGTAGAPR